MGALESDEAAIFDEVVQAQSVAERETLLEQHCGENLSLRYRIESLLDAYFNSEFLESLPSEILSLGRAETGLAGRQIGAFDVLELIGHGGMGDVYLARSREARPQFVAFKVIKAGMDTRQVISRFNLERTILQRLDHPNIASYVDSGIADCGRAFFAMELVQGMAVTDYCDRNRLSIEDRLRLFLDICSAVEHAHTLGIVHRDLKPQNMLVLRREGQVIAKVIDFGIAKALTATASDGSRLTAGIQWLGTPHYISPEQMNWSSDVDQRADVYSLGVVLYELLTGTTPIQRSAAEEWDLQSWREWMTTEDWHVPSQRIASHANDFDQEIFESRASDPGQLVRRVRGELDWITCKAIDRDRDRRYVSSRDLAADIRAHLDNRPVSVQAPSTTVRVRKWAKRNPRKVSMVKAIGLTACVLVGAFWTQGTMREMREARVLAESLPKHLEFVEDIQSIAALLKSEDTHSAQLLLDKYALPSGHAYSNHFAVGYLRSLKPEPSPIQTFAGHQHNILDMDFSKDGRWIASADRGGDILIWDRQAGREIRRLHPSDKEVTRVRFCPAGKLLATAGQDALVRLWNTEDWTQVGELSHHESTINGLDWSPDGIHIASGDRGGVVCIWNESARTLLKTLPPHAEAVRCLEWSPDGKRFATADGNVGVRLWNTDTWTEVGFVSDASHGILAIAFSPDSQTMAVGGYSRELVLVDVPSYGVVARLTAMEQIWSLAFGENRELFAGGGDGTIQLFSGGCTRDAWESTAVWPNAARKSSIRSLGISVSDGSESLLTASADERLIMVVPKAAFTGYDALHLGSSSIGLITDQFLLASDQDQLAIIKSPSDGVEVTKLPMAISGYPVVPAYSPQKKMVAIAGPNCLTHVFRTDTWEQVASLAFPLPLWAVSFSRDGNQLAIAGGYSGIGRAAPVRIWNIQERTFRDLTQFQHEVTLAAFSPTADLLIAGCPASHSLTCLNAKSFDEIRTVELSQWRKLFFHPRGDYLVVCHRGKFSVWKSDLSRKLWDGVVSPDDDEVEFVSILPDQELMAVLLRCGVVELWDLRMHAKLCAASVPIADCHNPWLAFRDPQTLLVGSEHNETLFRLQALP